jgi:hypothetical protein
VKIFEVYDSIFDNHCRHVFHFCHQAQLTKSKGKKFAEVVSDVFTVLEGPDFGMMGTFELIRINRTDEIIGFSGDQAVYTKRQLYKRLLDKLIIN